MSSVINQTASVPKAASAPQAASAPSRQRFETIRLRSVDGSTEAEFVPAANMVCTSLRHLGDEYVHQGSGVEAYAQHGMTMGIPLLHPWANRLNGFRYRVAGKEVALPSDRNAIPVDDAGLPIHGAIPALMRWDATLLTPASLTASLRWTSPELLRLFPFRHELTVDARLESGALTIATALAPSGRDSVPVSFGYHPYLRIPRKERSDWRVTLGARERLLLDEAMIPTGEREAVTRRCFTLAERDLDDAFDSLDRPAEFEAVAGDVSVKVAFLGGYSFAQVYAPADQNFICFEPMTAPTNALVSGDGLRLVLPGQRYHAAFRLSISGRQGHVLQ